MDHEETFAFEKAAICYLPLRRQSVVADTTVDIWQYQDDNFVVNLPDWQCRCVGDDPVIAWERHRRGKWKLIGKLENWRDEWVIDWVKSRL